MNEHFIREIEIKNYKLFTDFRAEGFGRINLIGGKNNVGKTALMEACYINNLDMNISIKNTIFSRYISDIVLELWEEVGKKYIDNFLEKEMSKYKNIDIQTNLKNPDINTFFFTNLKGNKNNYEEYYSHIIERELEDRLDLYIEGFDKSIEKFRIIKGKPYCKKNGKFYNLYEFGEGLGKFILLILILLSQSNNIIFIDEIENGIHYTQLDRVWEIILTLSKELNVQIFATTHSKECIEAYARVAKKLDDKDITFVELGRNRKNEIKALVMDSERFQREIAMDNEVRGW
jgi:AAA15 family ATPase/GTPase